MYGAADVMAESGKRQLSGSGAASDGGRLFKDEDTAARTGERKRCAEAVGACADNHCVELGAHFVPGGR
jgi:hypothetical protein